MNRLTKIIGAALSLALLPVASAVAAPLVVIDSTSPSYAAGTIFDAAKPLSISDGERITVVAAYGKTRTIQGPFVGVVDSGNGDIGLVQTLSELVKSDQTRTKIAAVRVGVAASAPDDIFLVRIGAKVARFRAPS